MSKTEVAQIEPKRSVRKRMSTTYIDQPSDTRPLEQNDEPTQPIGKEIAKEAAFTWPFVIYQLTICMPFFIYVGSTRFAPYKTYLLLAFLPSIVKVIMSKQTSLKLGDALIVGYTLLSVLSIINTPLTESILEPILSTVLETLGSYFLARAFVNSAAAFSTLIRTQLFLVIIVGLFSIYEATTGTNLFFKFFGAAFRTFAVSDMPERLGLHRAQGTFEHPILYGVYSSMIFGLCFYGLKTTHTNLQRYRRLAIVVIATFISLSTGAYISIVGQLAFIGWDKYITFTKHRWRLLLALSVLAYFVVDGFSNRTPFEVFITYMTFDTNSAYNRILIWTYGIAEVWRNPLLGKGLFIEWIRPVWMVASIDNFFLLRAMRHGLIAVVLLIGLLLWVITKLSNLKIESQLVRNYRTGFLVTIGGLCISLTTVDLWSGLYSYFFFLLGSTVWMIDYSKDLSRNAVEQAVIGTIGRDS